MRVFEEEEDTPVSEADDGEETAGGDAGIPLVDMELERVIPALYASKIR